ncbi:MAG: rhodanese domain-containing protein [Euryarchaeota archaeon]|nr:rhodanese domain-containing protein [Euryarchaeota archaeon]
MGEQYINIAGYRFVAIPDREEMRWPLRDFCVDLGLKGTILLSLEGINYFLSGTQDSIDKYLEHIEADERFAGIPLKISYSDHQPFSRMLVRLKKEIISMGHDDVKPAEFTGPCISPKEFKSWLDDGKEVIILDTRNDYEMKTGKFENAVDLNIKTFRQFPNAIKELPDELKGTPVVMYCTGGVRCEKASVVLLEEGFEDVRQLEGGILGYFEECGGEHWEGECFVFDKRVGVGPDLAETDTVVCYACREPLLTHEQASQDYEIGVSCPYCI